MFSLYEIGDFLLAFYTDIPSGPFSAIEVVDRDDTIFEIGASVCLLLLDLCLCILKTRLDCQMINCCAVLFVTVADLRLMLQNIITK